MASRETQDTEGRTAAEIGSASPAAALSSGRVPELDGVRGLAIALVVLCHYGAHQMTSAPGTAFNLLHIALTFGWVGVDLFFVLSGFLIGGILMENRNSPHFFSTFYLRRVCRIFPIYYLWLGGALVLLAAGLPEHLRKLVQPDVPFWSYFTYTQNLLLPKLGDFGNEWFGVTWSLAVEEQFYLLFPLLVRFCPATRLPRLLAVLAVSAVAFRAFAWFVLPAPGLTGFVLLPARWDSLCLGALTAWLVRRQGFIEGVKRYEQAIWIGGGAILAALAGMRLAHQGDLRSPAMHFAGLTLLAIFFCGLLLLALYSRRKWVTTFFRNVWLRRLGGISYGVYLIHQPVSYLLHAALWRQEPKMTNLPRALTTLLALGTTLGIASLSWRFFESKCVNWGRKFAY